MQCPQPCSRPPLTHASTRETPGHSRASLGPSLVGSLLLSPGSWCAHGFICALQESVSQSCVSSSGSMVGLMEAFSKRTYAIRRSAAPRAPAPAPAASTTDHITSGDIRLPFWLSLFGVSGSWYIQGLFEPSEHLWWVWGLILNAICPSYCLAGASLP